MKIFKGGKADPIAEESPKKEETKTPEKKPFFEWLGDITPTCIATVSEVATDVVIGIELGTWAIAKEALRKGWFKKPDYRMAIVAILAQLAVKAATSELSNSVLDSYTLRRKERKEAKQAKEAKETKE